MIWEVTSSHFCAQVLAAVFLTVCVYVSTYYVNIKLPEFVYSCENNLQVSWFFIFAEGLSPNETAVTALHLVPTNPRHCRHLANSGALTADQMFHCCNIPYIFNRCRLNNTSC